MVLDTGPLLLLVVGNYDPKYISAHKRTNCFHPSHYSWIANFIQNFSRVLITPNVATEASNLLCQDRAKREFLNLLRDRVVISEEPYVESRLSSNDPDYGVLGLTDVGLLLKAREGFLLLTHELELWRTARMQGIHAVNIFHEVQD